MKKTFSRAFSLLLVLALLVSVIPTALAASELTISATKNTLSAGEETTVSFTVSNADVPLPETGVTWSWTVGAGASTVGETNTSSITIKAGNVSTDTTVTIEATAQFTKDETPYTYTGSTTVTVKADVPQEGSVVIDGSERTSVVYGSNTTLTATYTPAGGTATTDGITWSAPTNNYFEISPTGVITTKKAGGPVVVTATAGEGAAAVNDTIEVIVDKKPLTASMNLDKATLSVGQAATATVTLSGLVGQDDVSSYLTVDNWRANTANKVDISNTTGNSATITGKSDGETTVSADVTLADNEKYTLEGASNGKKTVTSATITVNDAAISLGNYTDSLKNGSSTTSIITPSLKELPSGAGQDDITYTAVWTKSTGNATVSVNSSTNKKSIIISSPSGEGTVKVTITAWYGQQDLGSTDVIIGVYNDYVIRGTTNATSFKMGDNVFTSLTVNGWPQASNKMNLADALRGAGYETLYLKHGSNVCSSFSKMSTVANSLSSVLVTRVKEGTEILEYTWTGEGGVTVATGMIYLSMGAGEGDIIYSTSYNKKVTFDDADFTKFWNEKVKDKTVTGSLEYVTFDNLKLGNYNEYGQIYKDTSCSNYVVSTEKYCVGSSSKYYPLDNVTYKPNSNVTVPVTVTIPFTAHGSTSNNVAYGVVEIRINQESTTITSYGVGFGNGTNSITDYIVESFKANTNNATLSYVTFPAVSASTGKLLYDFSGVLDSREVLSTYKFYVNGKTTDLDLDDVVFVPRAGLYGEVTLYYKAYSANGNNEYSGTIVLNVKQKTKSAEFSDVGTSYSWAADSVDFLSYEGVAQGSNGKYRPTANITRGDFMLMLYRAFLEDEHKNDSITSNFSDVVKGSDTYSKETYQAVGVAKKLGIAQGTNGKFNPKSYITRQEAMTLIYRTLDEVNYDLEYTVSTSTSSFKDYSSVASYAKTAISDLIGHGIVIGNNSKINPTSNITRAEMAVILHRVLTY